MRAHQLDANGVIINTILVDTLDILPNLVDADIGGNIGDKIVDGVVVAAEIVVPAKVVPTSVTRRQARQALLLKGILDKVDAAIAGIGDATQRGLAKIEWEDSQVFERSRPFLIQIGAALGLDSAGLDDLFIFAATL